ncbi:MAG: homoserine O-acetyltransferase [Victivallales bacterium]|nr:homoserine O-acetyltransferase [Victivallales bacterium]MCF7888530.1 homoserine O-acetyltransferase [Victivallales bacterium]
MTNTVGIVKEKDFTFGKNEDDALILDSGKRLLDVNLRYETYGTLNKSRNNAILIQHALTGSAHVAGYHSENDRKPGWWNDMVGPGKAFDTDKYFIVCSNCIGGCSGSTGPRSVNPETGKRYNLSFPVITIADMVRAQYRLMKHLNIPKWLTVAGGSMGGMLVLQWVLDYPDKIDNVIAIATSPKHSPQAIAFNWVGRESIMNDPRWDNGNYEDEFPENGLATARMLAHITYLSEKSMDIKFGRKLRKLKNYAYNFSHNFEVESYLEYQGQTFVERFDANSYLYITRAMDYFDVTADFDGDLNKAFENIKTKFLVVSFSSDWLYPPTESRKIVKALRSSNVDVTYCNIDSHYGHDAFLLEAGTLGKLITGFLDANYLT